MEGAAENDGSNIVVTVGTVYQVTFDLCFLQ